MTIKDDLHSLIDRLDEEQASAMLRVGTRLEQYGQGQPLSGLEAGIDVDRDTLMLFVQPVTEDDPFWSAPPFDDDGPTDMSTNKHRYLAEIYGDLHDE